LLYSGEDDLLILAIRLCIGIAKNHPFADGNRRTATAAMIEFLAVNGAHLVIPDDEEETPLLGQWVERTVRGDMTIAQSDSRLRPFIQPNDG
jgi:death-on-curing protein